MVETVVCYLEKDNCFLMLHRNKREKDINKGKWIGVGGHIEKGETPEQAIKREVKEETSLDILECEKRGVVVFKSENSNEKMHIFTSKKFIGQVGDCDEGDLRWISKEDVTDLPLWEGDRIFLPNILHGGTFFSYQFNYVKDHLISYEVKNDL